VSRLFPAQDAKPDRVGRVVVVAAKVGLCVFPDRVKSRVEIIVNGGLAKDLGGIAGGKDGGEDGEDICSRRCR